MPYCPECRSEFLDDVKYCRECNKLLVSTLSNVEKQEDDNFEFTNIYLSGDRLEADNIATLLNREDIEVMVIDQTISLLPVSVGENSGFKIAVSREDRVKARSLIEEAIRDEYISANGSFINEE